MLSKLKKKKDAKKAAGGKVTLTAAEVRAARVEEDKSAWQWGYLADFDERPQVPLEGYFRHPCPDDLLPGPFAWFMSGGLYDMAGLMKIKRDSEKKGEWVYKAERKKAKAVARSTFLADRDTRTTAERLWQEWQKERHEWHERRTLVKTDKLPNLSGGVAVAQRLKQTNLCTWRRSVGGRDMYCTNVQLRLQKELPSHAEAARQGLTVCAWHIAKCVKAGPEDCDGVPGPPCDYPIGIPNPHALCIACYRKLPENPRELKPKRYDLFHQPGCHVDSMVRHQLFFNAVAAYKEPEVWDGKTRVCVYVHGEMAKCGNDAVYPLSRFCAYHVTRCLDPSCKKKVEVHNAQGLCRKHYLGKMGDVVPEKYLSALQVPGIILAPDADAVRKRGKRHMAAPKRHVHTHVERKTRRPSLYILLTTCDR